MEYFNSHDLIGKLTKENLTEQTVKFIFKQLLEVVEFLHSSGYYHRDIKLENILVNDKNEIKLIDFGFIVNDNENKLITSCAGSAEYASPEMLKRDYKYYKTHDVWCLGIVLYAMLYLFLPFRENNREDLYSSILGKTIEFPYSASFEARVITRDMLNRNSSVRPTSKKLLTYDWIKE